MNLELTLKEIEYMHDIFYNNNDLYLIENNKDSVNYNKTYNFIFDEIQDYLRYKDEDFQLMEFNYDDFRIITNLLNKHKDDKIAINILNKLDEMIKEQFIISCASNNVKNRMNNYQRIYYINADIVESYEREYTSCVNLGPFSSLLKARNYIKTINKNELEFNYIHKETVDIIK